MTIVVARKLRVALPYVLIFLVASGFLFPLAIGRPELMAKGLLIVVPSAAALLWMFVYSRDTNHANTWSWRVNQRSLLLAFGIIYAISVIVLATHNVRPWHYFLSVAGMYSAVLVQILLKRVSHKLILAQLALLMLNIAWGLTLRYPLYFGGTDTFLHIRLSEIIISHGYVVSPLVEGTYAYFPLYHILASVSSLLTGLPVSGSIFLLAPLIFAIPLPFLYHIVRSVSKDSRMAMMTCLIYASSPVVIYYSFYVITRVFAYVLFVGILFALYRTREKRNVSFRGLAILMAFAIILFHPVSIVQFLFILLLLVICERVLNSPRHINAQFCLLLIVMFFAYWLFVAVAFSASLIGFLLEPSRFETIVLSPMSGDNVRFFIDNLSYGVFLFFTLIGIHRLLGLGEYFPVIGLVGLFLLIFYIPNPLMAIQQLQLFGLYRLELFVIALVAIPGAVGIIEFYKRFQRLNINSAKVIACGVGCFLIFGAFLTSVYNGANASDSQKGVPSRYFLESDVATLSFVEETAPMNSSVYSDYFVARYFLSRKYLPGMQPYGSTHQHGVVLNSIDELGDFEGYFVFRHGEFLSKGVLSLGTDSSVYEIQYSPATIQQIDSFLATTDQIYDGGRNEVYSS